MNKKFIAFGIITLFAFAMVSAVAYYTIFSATFNITPAITTEGDLTQELDTTYSGDSVNGSAINVSNDATSSRTITITDDSDDEVEVSYVSTLTLAQKNVDFESDVWSLLSGGDTAVVRYTLVGNEFSAKVIDGEKDGYVLVYSKDNLDRFNEPATTIGVDSISANLPYEDDANAEEYDYCATGEYDTCHGAKIWYVPETAVDTEGNIVWSQADDFLFETELIQYNSDGEIVVYPSQTLEIKPVYTPSDYASGEKTITTTIA